MRISGISNKGLLGAAFVISFIVATYSFALQTVFAATGQIYLTPASSSLSYGSSVKLNLRINPGATVDGVQATVNFDTTKLQYIGTDTSNSAFSVQLQQSVSGGTITIARGDFSGGISSDAQIAGITFKSLVYSGSGSVTLTNANATSAGSYTNPSVANATITLTAGSCPAGQTGTPPSCVTPPPVTTTGGGTTTPKPAPSTTPKPATGGSTSSAAGAGGTTAAPAVPQSPAVGKPSITKQEVQYTKFELGVTTPQPVQVYLEYGLTQKLGQQTALTSTPATSHTLSLDGKTIIPGQTYYYRVVARDAAGNVTAGDLQKITAKGMTVRATVLDKNKKPLSNKSVTLHSTPITAKTDKHGVVTFTNVAPGTHEVIYTAGKKTYTQQINVANNVQTTGAVESAVPQNFSVVYSFAQRSLLASLSPLLILIVLAAVGYYLYRRRNNRNDNDGQIIPENHITIGGSGAPVVRPLQITSPPPRPVPVPPSAPVASMPPTPVASSTSPTGPTPSFATPTTTKVEVH